MRASVRCWGVNPAMRRAWLAENTGNSLDEAASMAFTPDEGRASIENLVGATHLPLGVAGPIRVNGDYADGSYFVPFATTEGTAEVELSLSHRAGRGLAAVASAGAPVGCDLELIEARSAAFVRQWLAPAERELVSRARVTPSSPGWRT